MAYQKNLQVPYHQQDTDYYCGAACAQMVLDSVGAGLLDQAGLYTDNHNHTSWDQSLYNALGQKVEWATNPDGLAWTLNDRDTDPHHVYYQYPLQSEDVASRKIAWTIEHYGVAPCALVMGAAHWIVVRGMDLSKAPTGSGDTGYAINSFRVNDPWPPVPSSSYWANPSQPPPPPHNAGDGCGTGGNRGVADEVIAYNQWQNTYMTAANYHAQGHWQGLFVAVCDPEPPAIRRGRSVRLSRRFDGERVIHSDDAARLATELIERRTYIPDDEIWQRSLKNVKPAPAVLVQRLDRLDEYYYVVPLVSTRTAATAALLFDARFGDFQQAVSFPKPEQSIVNWPSSQAVLKQVVGKTFELERYQGPLHIREGVATVLDFWFWKPCRESLSPLWPFKMIVIGGNTLYFRIDGQVFTALHDNVLGL
jgi:hypothetical protein